MLNAKLLVVGGEVKTTEIKLRLPCVIGRGKGSTVILPHPLVSRQHCELFESNGCLWVRDLGSLNGTYVNNQKVTETELPPNELLTIGTVTFRAMYEPALHDATLHDQAGLVTPVQGPAAHESASTVRVDAPVPEAIAPEESGSLASMTSLGALDSADHDLENGDLENGELVEDGLLGLDDSDGNGVMPSAPLYSTDSASHAPALPPQLYPGAPMIPSMGITPQPAPAFPPQASEEPVEEEEEAGDDEDLNDFLNSLEKK